VTLATYFWGILLVTLITTGYTVVGGIKAVVWTDLIQATLMLGSVAFVLWYLVAHLGACLGRFRPQGAGITCNGSRWDGTPPFPSARPSRGCSPSRTRSSPR